MVYSRVFQLGEGTFGLVFVQGDRMGDGVEAFLKIQRGHGFLYGLLERGYVLLEKLLEGMVDEVAVVANGDLFEMGMGRKGFEREIGDAGLDRNVTWT